MHTNTPAARRATCEGEKALLCWENTFQRLLKADRLQMENLLREKYRRKRHIQTNKHQHTSTYSMCI